MGYLPKDLTFAFYSPMMRTLEDPEAHLWRRSNRPPLAETARLSHYFLPRLLGAGKNVLMLDGANSADPRLLERLARERGVEFGEFSRHMRIARAFTCFQLTELVARVPRLVGDLPAQAGFPAQVLVVTALPDLYFDEDIRDGDARAAFARALGDLRRWARGCSVGAAASPVAIRRGDSRLDFAHRPDPSLVPFDRLTALSEVEGQGQSEEVKSEPVEGRIAPTGPLAVAIFSSAADFSPSPARRHFFAQVAAAATEVWRFSLDKDGRPKLLSERLPARQALTPSPLTPLPSGERVSRFIGTGKG
ncbi:MAG: hypothetical protein DMG22_11145 [Acidobacteria bacterium]|nr:MAG: hypothetical protein DMG22_11145 [Acidobacteriota bacterium]